MESKAMWGADIAGKTDSQLMGCISNCKARVRAGDGDWLWPNIGLVLGYVDNSWEHAATRKPYVHREQIEDITKKEANQQLASEVFAQMREQGLMR